MTILAQDLDKENFPGATVIAHGFADYMRDYEIFVAGRFGPPFDDIHRYQFIGCVEATVGSNLDPQVFKESVGDEFVFAGPDYRDKPEPNGFIWGLRYSTAHWGMLIIKDSDSVRRWSESTGLMMTAISISTEAFTIELVFTDFRYEYLGKVDPRMYVRRSFPIEQPVGQ